MARLTVEDCLRYVKNRFDLVLKASKRARMIERGAAPLVSWDNDKPTVVALREIAEGLKPEEKKTEEISLGEQLSEIDAEIMDHEQESAPEELDTLINISSESEEPSVTEDIADINNMEAKDKNRDPFELSEDDEDDTGSSSETDSGSSDFDDENEDS